MKNILPNTVFTFHKINSSQWFEDIIILLKGLYTFVSAEEIENFYYNKKKIKNSCHLTFDDGERSFYDVVFPILKKYSIPSSIFVLPPIIKTGSNFWAQEIEGYDHNALKSIISKNKGWDLSKIQLFPIIPILKSLTINEIWKVIEQYQNDNAIPCKSSQNLSLNEIKELNGSGLVSIGAHTMTHPILKNESEEKVNFEIVQSVNELTEILGKKVTYFAFPNGEPGTDFTTREINVLKKAGIKIAYSTQYKKFTGNDNPLSVPRKVLCNGSKNFMYFELFTGFNWDMLETIKKGSSEKNSRKKLAKIIK